MIWAGLILACLVIGNQGSALAAGGTEARDQSVEIGVFGGAYFPGDRHEFFEIGVADQGPLEDVAPTVGLRLGYFPWAFIGAEAEFSWVPTVLDGEADASANLLNGRGHLIGRLPGMRFTPLAVAGVTAGGVLSSNSVLGDDVDLLAHYGVGAEFFATDDFAVRLDLRHSLGPTLSEGDPNISNHFEVLVGLSHVLGGRSDADGDGIADKDDRCPEVAGVAPTGCPDGDGDGVIDAEDMCVAAAGPAPTGCSDTDGDGKHDGVDQCVKEPGDREDGCPDSDGDGFIDSEDDCPDESGIAPDGCPDPDPDRDLILGAADQCPKVAGVPPDGCPDSDEDGISDRVDRCPNKPETRNGFQDKDGCPDELPKEVKRFVGVIQGITFANGRARIRPRSFRQLDRAAEVLKTYPELRLEISGHTDSTGSADLNARLSRARADAVKTYLVSQGIDASRLTTKGFGPSQPVATNRTAAGRARNRRIEFKLIQ